MILRWVCAVLSSVISVALILILSGVDHELPKPPLYGCVIIGILTGAVCWWVNYFHTGLLWYSGLFMVYLALTIYTDARIHQVYTIINLVMLAGTVLLNLVLWICGEKWQWMPLTIGLVLLLMGFFGIYGRGDGYVLATMMIYIGMICEDSLMAMLGTILVGCGCFVIYSLIDYLWKKTKKKRAGERSAVRFWKEKRPLLPSLGIGMIIITLIVP